MKEKKLWTRKAATYVAEIQVGQAWVEASGTQHQLPSEAESEASKALAAESSVSAARVCETCTTQVRTVTWEEKSAASVRVPKGMRRTSSEADCPVCGSSVPVLTDGAMRWAACKVCARTLPVGGA